MSDVMHGPSVGMPGTRQRRKTYLIEGRQGFM